MDCPEMQELETLFQESLGLQEQSFKLSAMAETVQAGLVNRELAQLTLAACPDAFDTARYPLVSFTEQPSNVNSEILLSAWGKALTVVNTVGSNLSLRMGIAILGVVLYILNRIRKRLFGNSEEKESGASTAGPSYSPPEVRPDVSEDDWARMVDELKGERSIAIALSSMEMDIEWSKIQREVPLMLSLFDSVLSAVTNVPTVLADAYEQFKDEVTIGKTREGQLNSVVFLPRDQGDLINVPSVQPYFVRFDQCLGGELLPEKLAASLLTVFDRDTGIANFGKHLGWPDQSTYWMEKRYIRTGVPEVKRCSKLIDYGRQVHPGSKDSIQPLPRGTGRALTGVGAKVHARDVERKLNELRTSGKLKAAFQRNWCSSLKVWDKKSVDRLEAKVEAMQERLKKVLASDEWTKASERHDFTTTARPTLGTREPHFRLTQPASRQAGEVAELDNRTMKPMHASANWAIVSTYGFILQEELGRFVNATHIAPLKHILNVLNAELDADAKINKAMSNYGITLR